jgi:hypothetical protein
MPDFVINCPTSTCAKPLNLPANAVGRSLSCPHCKAPFGVTLGPDGTPIGTVAIPTSRRVPGLFLFPGFALLILGGAGAFINGYIAWDSSTRAEAALEHGQRLVGDLRSFEALTAPAKESKGKPGDVTPQDLFAAVAGQAARIAEQQHQDNALAAGWAPRVAGLHMLFLGISIVSAAGGVAMLRGKWYWLALVGCFAGMLNFNSACCVPAGIAGLWGLLVLVRDDGRKFFGRA